MTLPAPTGGPPAASPWHLSLLSAESEAGLTDALEALRAPPDAPAPPPGPVRVLRPAAGPGRHRGALLLGGAAAAPYVPVSGLVEGPPRPVALMFPGVGDQYVNMGLELYRLEPAFRDALDRCAELLRPEIGLDVRDVLYPKRAAAPAAPAGGGIDLRKMLGRGRGPDPDEQRLAQTVVVQPAVFAVEYALARLWQSWGVGPEIMLGYSLGEYVAACLAGVLSLEAALALVARRAQLIDALPAGAMLAVSLDEAGAAPLLGEHLSLAAINGPDLSVIAGPPDEIDALAERLAEAGVTARRVQSTHAFHSKMMLPIAPRVARLVEGLAPKPPQIPYVSNVTGAPITAAEATDPAYWSAHLCRPVRFADGLRALAARRERVLLEAGPGQSLSSLATLNAGGAPDPSRVVASMRHSYDAQPDAAVFLKAVARLWVAGADLDWARLPAAPLPAPAADGASAAPAADETAAAPAGGAAPGADTAPAPATANATSTERELAALWQKLLAGQEVRPEASFFELGGNSLLATRLIYRVSKAFRVDLSVQRVYEVPTLAAMAAAIDALRPAPGRQDGP